MTAPHSWAVFQTGRTEDYYASAFTLGLPTLRFLRTINLAVDRRSTFDQPEITSGRSVTNVWFTATVYLCCIALIFFAYTSNSNVKRSPIYL